MISKVVDTGKIELSPLYYFYSVGCGWCKKTEPIVDELNKEGHDILKLDLSDPENKKINDELKKEFKTQCGTPWLINADTGHQICGFREKDIVVKWVRGEEIPEQPKPKSAPPPQPADFEDKDLVDTWKKSYMKWKADNNHVPNIPDVDIMLENLKKQKEMMAQRQQQGQTQNLEMSNRISGIEQKLDKLMKHLGVQ
jgi:thiol-disulfide isomerase/thioredoxin